MTTKFRHSVELPPQPRTWHIRWDLHDAEIILICPNGHEMKLPATRDFLGISTIPLNTPFRCFRCGFSDIVYLVSEDYSKLTIPLFEGECNCQSHRIYFSWVCPVHQTMSQPELEYIMLKQKNLGKGGSELAQTEEEQK